MTEYNSYALSFISNKRNLYLYIHCQKETTPKRFYNLVDRIVSCCLNDKFVEAIQTKLYDSVLNDEEKYYELDSYKAEIDIDNILVMLDYGFVCQVNIKFEDFHDSGINLIEKILGIILLG